MKTFYLIIILLLCFCNSICSQNIIEKLKKFYENSDFACYEKKIQKDLQKYDSTINKLIPEPQLGLKYYNVRQAHVDLSKENKIFALAITLANTEKYNFEDNIYDYIIIDSLRSFIIICVDKKMNVTGFTDTVEPGSFVDIKDDFYFPKRSRRRQIRVSIKNIKKEKPEIILYCAEFKNSFMYIKDNEIYLYNMKEGKGEKFNETVREAPDINIIRRSNHIMWPLAKDIEAGSHPLTYRLTGQTPKNEIRICPAKRDKGEATK